MATVLYEPLDAPASRQQGDEGKDPDGLSGAQTALSMMAVDSAALQFRPQPVSLKHSVSSAMLDRYERTVNYCNSHAYSGTKSLGSSNPPLVTTTEEDESCATWESASDGNVAARDMGYVNWTAGVTESPSKKPSRKGARHDVMWSDEFHDLLIALSKAHSSEEEEVLFESLRKLELDFVYTAETWGRVIIEELFLPDDKKTIKPLQGDGAGFLGGYKYEVRGVFFKFAHEIHNLVSSSDAAKLSGHEMRACSAVALYALESQDFTLLPPLMTLVDFRGYRLLAVSQLPVKGAETLIYGSNDGGKTVRNSDSRFMRAIENLGAHFNLAKHLSGADNSTELYTGTDVEGHHDPVRDRYYLLDLSRLFPPEAPSTVAPLREQFFIERPSCNDGCKCRIWRERLDLRLQQTKRQEEENPGSTVPSTGAELMDAVGQANNPRLYKQLRPFFLQQEECSPLCSDAFSRFQSPLDAAQANLLVEQQTARLKGVCVHRACVYLEHREADSELYPNNFSFSHFLHERGLNVRLLGLIYARISPKSKWRRLCLVEMVARVFKSFVRSRFRSLARRKGDTVLIAGVVNVKNTAVFRASAEDFHEEATRLLSLLVMNIDPANAARSDTKALEDEEARLESFAFWDALVVLMKQKFGFAEAINALSDAEALDPRFLCPIRLPELLKPSLRQLLERACSALGFQIASPRVLSQPVTPDAPLSADALLDLKPVVKHLNLIHVAEAKVLHHRALRERNQRACEMLRRARMRLENVLREAPPVSSPFLLETLGEILYALAIRVQPERMEFELSDESLRNLMKAETAFREIATRSSTSKREDGTKDGDVASSVNQHSLVLKTQHAKRFANVVSSIIMNDLPGAKGVLRLGDVVVTVARKQFRFWDVKKKLLVWTYECDEELAAWTVLPGTQTAVFIGQHGERMQIMDEKSSAVSELQIEEPTSQTPFAMDERPFVVGLAACLDDSGQTILVHVRADGKAVVSRITQSRKSVELDIVKRFDLENIEGRITAVSSARNLVAIAETKRIHVFNNQLVPMFTFSVTLKPIVTCISVSPHAQYLAAGLHDGTILVWFLKEDGGSEVIDAAESRPPVILKGHMGKVSCVFFAGERWPNQDTLMTGSTDRTVRVWNVRLGTCVRVLAGHLDSVQGLHFNEDDKLLVTAAMDSRVRTWRFDQVPFLPINSPDLPEQQALLSQEIAEATREQEAQLDSFKAASTKGQKRKKSFASAFCLA